MNITLIFAGGVGTRMGSDIPKQFLEWNDKPILIHTMDVFEEHPEVDEIVLVCKSDWMEYASDLVAKFNISKVVSIVEGGDTALDSQYNGLKEIKRLFPDEDVMVLIHDGVRPLIDHDTITRNIDCAKQNGNAITTSNATETIIRINDNEKVSEVYDRYHCKMARAPQTFNLDDILKVHEMARKANYRNYIDSASMMMAYGFELHTIDGTAENIKITTPSDYYAACALLDLRKKRT